MIIKLRRPILNRSHRLAKGIVGAWAFFERGGTVLDLAGNHNGTITNLSLATKWVIEEPGLALSFDGNVSNGYVSLGGNETDFDTNTFTLFMLVKPGTQTNSYAVLFSKQDHTSSIYRGWFVDRDNVSATDYRIGFGNGSDYIVATNRITLITGAWQDFAITSNQHIYRAFVDGVFQWTETESSAYIGNNDSPRIGDWADSGGTRRPWVGECALCLFYNIVLSDSAVRELHDNPWIIFRPPDPMTFSPRIFSPTYTDYGVTFQYDPTKYNSPAVYLEATLKTSNVTQSAFARLFNVTDSQIVAGSEISTSSTSFTRVRSSALSLPAGAKEYKMQIGIEALYTVTCKAGRLVIDV